jgi:ABC-type transporter MlaC component
MHRIFRRSLLVAVLTVFAAAPALPAMAQSPAATAGTASGFLEGKLKAVRAQLNAPGSAEREKKIDAELSTLVDYDEMARTALGAGCTTSAECDQYKVRTKEELAEFTDILRKLIEKNYKKRLQDTLNFEISNKGEEPKGGDALVKTEAKNLKDKKASPILIDYVVRKKGSGFIVIDIVPEGSSMAKTYNKEFTKVIRKDGWATLIKKMKDKLAKS